MKKQDKLPEHDLSDLTVDDLLSGKFESDSYPIEAEFELEDEIEEDLILGDEDALDDEDEVEYEIELEDDDDVDDDDLDEDDLILDADDLDDDEDLDDLDEDEADDL